MNPATIERKIIICGYAALVLLATAAVGRGDTLIEGFENGNLDNYQALSGGTNYYTPSVTPADAHSGNYGLQLDGQSWYGRLDPAVQLSQGDSFYAWILTPNSQGAAYFGFGASTSSTYSIVLNVAADGFFVQYDTYSGSSSSYEAFDYIGQTSQTYLENTWYKVVVDWGADGQIVADLYASDGSTLLNTVTAQDDTITSGGLAFRAFGSTYVGSAGAPSGFDDVTLITDAPEPASFWLCAGVVAFLPGWSSMRRLRGAAYEPRELIHR